MSVLSSDSILKLYVLKSQKILLRYLTSSKRPLNKEIVIASAVRTPIASYQNLNAVQLGALAIEGAWKQSAITKDKIQKVYLYNSDTKDTQNLDVAKKAAELIGLNKTECATLTTDSIDSLRSAADDLDAGRANVVIAGSLESVKSAEDLKVQAEPPKKALNLAKRFHLTEEDLRNFHGENHNRLYIAAQQSVFDAEILPVRMRKDRQIFTKTNDEVESGGTQNPNGAAAVVLTTSDYAQEIGVHPLAKLVDFEVTQTNPKGISLAPTQTVRKLLERNSLEVNDVARWEVQSCAPGMTLAFAELTNIAPQKINLHGLCATLEKPIHLASICLVTHLSHTLQPQDKGIAVVSNDYGLTTAILLEKLTIPDVGGIPKLTLFTKSNCMLCDTLLEELESHFPGEFEMEKVFIDQKENIQYLRLYRNDIPVVFLNGQFLCMHKLNINLLRNKLDMLRAQANPDTN